MVQQRDVVCWVFLFYWAAIARGSRDSHRLNCFAQVDESKWSLVVEHNATRASLVLFAARGGPNVVACLNRQASVEYRVVVRGDKSSDRFLHPQLHSWRGAAAEMLNQPPVFTYLAYGGRYRVEFARCAIRQCEQVVYSDYINIQSDVKPWCRYEAAVESVPTNTSNQPAAAAAAPAPSVSDGRGRFEFAYQPCTNVQPYDTVNVSLHRSVDSATCGNESILMETVRVGENPDGTANISYQTPEVVGDHYYCVTLTPSHVSCHLESVQPAPDYCTLKSAPVWIRARPIIAKLFPFCRTHLACLWLYIAVLGSVILLLSIVLSILCVRCCDRRTRSKHSIHRDIDEVDFSGEVINLTAALQLPERRTWSELHAEWDSGEERSRGKILLLYSPDTKLFKELQEAFKSFLDSACHCDIYDLFDDALFDTIALDPSVWLEEFVNDRDVKIIIISSIGAYRRQMALQGQMPLNLPENSLLDGLFTSGLRFISSYPGLADSGRVATARYEMLHLTEPGHGLLPPVGGNANREFLIPTQLHEMFCWVHHLQPLDLMGKPWTNYHLELQLLQDALKLVRRDRTSLGHWTGVTNGNGLTMV